MKKLISIFLLISIVLFSCKKEEIEENSNIYGNWEVEETYRFNCDGQADTNKYTYEISINKWQVDSIVISNLYYHNSFYGYISGNTIIVAQVSYGFPPYSCVTIGSILNNKIDFTSVDKCNNYAQSSYMFYNCNGSASINYRSIIATKQ